MKNFMKLSKHIAMKKVYNMSKGNETLCHVVVYIKYFTLTTNSILTVSSPVNFKNVIYRTFYSRRYQQLCSVYQIIAVILQNFQLQLV